jgi:hypothetical protein
MPSGEFRSKDNGKRRRKERKMRKILTGLMLTIILCAPMMVSAQLSKEDSAKAKKMVAGTFYLRVQVPQKCGLGGYSDSILQASPSGLNTERLLAEPLKKGEDIYWGYLANTQVHYGELRWEKGKMLLWTERAEPETDFSIEFVDIKSLDDFSKAFNLALSRVPLQNEHPEWPKAVRDGIATVELVEGMTQEQARIVTGVPLSVTTDAGSGTETWVLRQDPGIVTGWSNGRGAHLKVSKTTGLPLKITFKDGKLLPVEAAQAPARKLDANGNAWLDAHKDPPEIHVGGMWYERAWGWVYLHQIQGIVVGDDMVGDKTEYGVEGAVSGKQLFLILTYKGKNQYSGVLSLTADGRLEGKYDGGLMKDESKGRSIKLIRKN